ncbi:MAG: acetate/propionate family kinase [Opitutaceae bacterium]
MRLLVANIGSTSFKFRLFEMPSERLLAKGGAGRIGAAASGWTFAPAGAAPSEGTSCFSGYGDAIGHFEKLLREAGVLGSFRELVAVGFKPVMAQGISGTQVFDDRLLGAMEALYTLFPAHNPPYVNAVREFQRLYPELPCIGTFETAFFDHLPRAATRFPVPIEWEKKYDIKRTGFHGASHRFVTERAAELRGSKSLRIISCHLGGSSSICAVRDGKAIDSSWGMTPQSGLPQNNRSGDLDVFAIIHLVRNIGLDIAEVEKQLGANSGLQGMSGLNSGDFRDLRAAAESGNEDAASAIEVFVSSVRGYIGRFLVALNGCDVLVFTAGIGENNAGLRAAICRDLDFCGLKLDEAANAACQATEAVISAPDSRVEVRVIPTNEELVIARNAWAKLGNTVSTANERE